MALTSSYCTASWLSLGITGTFRKRLNHFISVHRDHAQTLINPANSIMISAAEVRRALSVLAVHDNCFVFADVPAVADEKEMYSLASFAFYKAIMTVLCWHALAVLTDKDFCACVPVRVCWGCAGVSSGERTSGWGNILALLTTHVCGYTLSVALSSFLDVSRMCRYSIYLWLML